MVDGELNSGNEVLKTPRGFLFCFVLFYGRQPGLVLGTSNESPES